jgi:MarC family membrane protein
MGYPKDSRIDFIPKKSRFDIMSVIYYSVYFFMEKFDLFGFFVTLFIIANPMAALPVFLAVTAGDTLEEKKKVAIKASIAVFVTFSIMVFFGKWFLTVLSIDVHAFEVMGGLILVMLAFTMLNGDGSKFRSSKEEKREASLRESVAIVPLAIPLISGPGAMSTIIIRSTNHPGLHYQLVILACCLVISFIIGLIWYFAGTLERRLGYSGINVINRIGGLFLGAISLQTLASGIIGFFPRLVQ